MFQSRRALIYQPNSFLRSNPLCRNTYASIPNKNQGSTTPEDLTKPYKTPEERRGLDGSTYGGPGAMHVGNRGERWREVDADAYEEPRETAESVAQTARVAAVGAVETGLKIGKMAKQMVDGVWEVVEKTGENVRDSIAEDVNDGGRRRAQTAGEEQRSDKFVEELRRRGGGYDLKDRW